MLRYLLICLSFFSLSAFALSEYVEVGLQSIKIDQKEYIAVNLKNKEGWHTYWKNPGDAGLPIDIKFFSDGQQIQFKELEWPTPKRYIEQGNLWAYGYSDLNTFFFEIPNDLKETLNSKSITFHGKWLVCLDICIPDQFKTNFKLHQLTTGLGVKRSQEELNKAFQKIPQASKTPSNIEVYLNKNADKNSFVLNATVKDFDPKKLDTKRNLLTPFNQVPFGFKHEQLYLDQSTSTLYARMEVDWDGDLQEPPIDFPESGQFEKERALKFILNYDNQNIIITQSIRDFDLVGQKTLDAYYKKIEKWDHSKKTNSNNKSTKDSILVVLIFAFLGGLILNLMPCVLPVISFKLFGLMVHRDEKPKMILKHNLFYTLGVLFSFIALGVIVILLKSGGEQVGWGFQLQSPLFVFGMIILLYILSLNLFGFFEFVTPWGSKIGNKELKQGFTGDFLGGVFATILATPCSAPFLGTALTYAFTTTNINIILVFSMIGLGLAFPFIVTGIFPKMISFLPKPGPWMEKLKQFLGLTLLLTVVWLYDVLANLIDYSLFGIYLNTLLVLIFFQVKFKPNNSSKWIIKSLPILVFLYMLKLGSFEVSNSQSNIRSHSNLNWKKWSTQALEENKGQWVFMDFTAKWCLTCKVNKKLVLETDGFENLTKEKNLTLLVGDWTKRDDNITKWLRQYEVVGVPAYFLQTPEGRIIHLGEVISLDKLRANIK